MAKWLRVDAACDEHPKMLAAGPWGSMVVLAIWRRAKMFDMHDGDVTRFWAATPIARQLKLDAWSSGKTTGFDLVQEGMEAALREGLVEERSGRFFIHDWQDYQRDPTGAVRQKKCRANKKAATERNGQSRVTDSGHALHRDVTLDRTGQDRTKSKLADAGDPTTPTPDSPVQVPAQCTELARRHGILEQQHGRRPKSVEQMAQDYATADAAPPPGAPPAQWDAYYKRVSAALEHVYGGECRLWDDDTPFHHHTRSPSALLKLLPSIEEDILRWELTPIPQWATPRRKP